LTPTLRTSEQPHHVASPGNSRSCSYRSAFDHLINGVSPQDLVDADLGGAKRGTTSSPDRPRLPIGYWTACAASQVVLLRSEAWVSQAS